MSPAEVEAYLREEIPMSGGMGIRVVDASPAGVTIEVPLEPNINHHATAFGGSVAALAILAGWTMVHVRLRDENRTVRTVIQGSSIRYDAPIHEDFRAVAKPVDDIAWSRFTRALDRRGKGRVLVSVEVEVGGRVAASFEGSYVALVD